MSVFSERLKQQREKRHWTKTYISRLLHLPLSTYANYEYGSREPDIQTISKFSDLFDTTNDYLMGKTNNPSKDNKLDLDLKDNPHLLDMLSYNGQHLDDETKQMYLRLAKSQLLAQKDRDKNE